MTTPPFGPGWPMVLDYEPDMVHVGGAASVAEVGPLIYRTRPDAVVLDYHLPDGNGLEVARSIKSCAPAPKIVLYSAYADSTFVVPGLVAGIDGIINKGAQPNELLRGDPHGRRRRARAAGAHARPAPGRGPHARAGGPADPRHAPRAHGARATSPRCCAARPRSSSAASRACSPRWRASLA